MSRRFRTIKGSVILEDERAAELSDAAWRLWVALRTFADDFGVFRAGARYLAAQVWQDTGRAKKIPALLEELIAAGLIALYDAAGQTYGAIAGWDDEQRLDYRSEKTRLPHPGNTPIESIRDVAGILGQVRRGVPEDSGASPKIGKDAARAGACDPDPDPLPDPQSGSVSASEARPVRPPDPPSEPARSTTEQIAMAYAVGVNDGGQTMITPPHVFQDAQRLALALATHGPKDASLEDQKAWVTAQAASYAASADDFNRRRGFPVSGFLEALNGKGARRANVQPVARGRPAWTPAPTIRSTTKAGTHD